MDGFLKGLFLLWKHAILMACLLITFMQIFLKNRVLYKFFIQRGHVFQVLSFLRFPRDSSFPNSPY